MNKEYYTVRETAKILEIREQTVRDYISAGRFESKKIYNSTVISKDQINKYKNERGAN